MIESSVEFARLEYALVEAAGLLADLPAHDIECRLHELKLRSYVLLCHAAIEEYLERVSVSVLRESFEAFEMDGKVRDPLLCACSYYNICVPMEISTRRDGDPFQAIFQKLCEKAISEHDLAIRQNNGIKTKDQDAIFLPIGVRLHDFDRILSQGLNSYGTTRGKFAHVFGFQSITPRIGQEKTVWNLVRLLRDLDNMLCCRYRLSFHLT
jgi:hypothetical protein